MAILASFNGGPHFGMSYGEDLKDTHEELRHLIKRVTIELKLINVATDLER